VREGNSLPPGVYLGMGYLKLDGCWQERIFLFKDNFSMSGFMNEFLKCKGSRRERGSWKRAALSELFWRIAISV